MWVKVCFFENIDKMMIRESYNSIDVIYRS